MRQRYPTRERVFTNLLACTRALSEVAWSFHWRARGDNFYSDHELFGRIYSETHAAIDQIAEKGISVTGNPEIVNPARSLVLTAEIAREFAPVNLRPEDFAAHLLLYVKSHVALIGEFLAALDEAGELTDGVDNLLQGLADKGEEHAYLLQQRCARHLVYDHAVAPTDSLAESPPVEGETYSTHDMSTSASTLSRLVAEVVNG